MFRVPRKYGFLVQLWALGMIHCAVVLELYVNFTQPVYDMLEELGEYENLFNYITGWPLYFLVTGYYLLACLQSPGSPVSNWVSTM